VSTKDDAAGVGQLIGVTLDSADPVTLAEFYRRVTGWDVTYATDDLVVLGEGPVRPAVQRVGDHRRPEWPGPDKQLHLDFSVPDLANAEAMVLTFGATKPEFQPDSESFRVYLDPATGESRRSAL